MKRPLISVILPVLVCMLICILSLGPVMAQSSRPGRTFATKYGPPQQTPREAPKEVPKEIPKEAAASTPTEKNAADLNKQPASKPEPRIKMSPIRITLGGGQNNRSTRPPAVQISPQDIVKIQKIMEIINMGQKKRR
jgi:hypothetical protein